MHDNYERIPAEVQKHLALKLDRNEPFTLVITDSRMQLTVPAPTVREVMISGLREVLIAGVLIALIAAFSNYLA